MNIIFCTRGRLGNAIFRYLAASVMCIQFDGTYYTQYDNIPTNSFQTITYNDDDFNNISAKLLLDTNIDIQHNLIMESFYQHDAIYKKYKKQIFDFIRNNPQHYVVTDGILSGDNNCQRFLMKDILDSPANFSKKYKNVLHIRLEDFVSIDLVIKPDRIISLFDNNIYIHDICIVCKEPTTQFEYSHLDVIQKYLQSKDITVFIEHNDILTDYNIMKSAEMLICSNSTLSWCAAFFSISIQKCYLPDYTNSSNSTCKYPIDNTELY